MPRWLVLLIGGAVCVLIAVLVAPEVPDPGADIVAILAWIGAVLCFALAAIGLFRSL